MPKLTFSIIKADVGGWPGHASVHPDLLERASTALDEGLETGLVKDYVVTACGDDLELILTHARGDDNEEIHALAWNAFTKATARAKELKLYGAGQDLLADSFSGNVRGMGPGVAEGTFTERTAEPVVAFLMDKTEPGAFNLPIYKIFGDPFNTSGLIIDQNLHLGFRFEVWDVLNHTRVMLSLPEDTYDLLALIGAKSRFVVKRVFPKKGHKLPEDEPVAVVSTERLVEVAGEYVGKDDPVAWVRAQSGLPAVGEVMEPFAFPHLVSGWMRGSHIGPIMPCSVEDAKCVRFDGPPRVVGLGFQVANGTLVGPVDMFDNPAYDAARAKATEIADYLRRHGPFEPHRLHMEEMEYTTLPKVIKRLEDRWEKVPEVKKAGKVTVGEDLE
ncbi:MAG: fructose-1,6-bisphosphate aldolase/phosphatase [Methanobacteriota archaeon]